MIKQLVFFKKMTREKAVVLFVLYQRITHRTPPECSKMIKKMVMDLIKPCSVCKIECFFIPKIVDMYYSFGQYANRGDWYPIHKLMCKECADISDDFFDSTYESTPDMTVKIMDKKKEYESKGGYISREELFYMEYAALTIQVWWRGIKNHQV